MNVNLFVLDSWICDNDNKPSLQCFQQLLAMAEPTVLGGTVDCPTLKDIVVQAMLNGQDIASLSVFNYIQYGNTWYRITDISVRQDNEILIPSLIVTVTGEIDVYLSFMVELFDEMSTCNTPLFFIKKHMNRWFFIDGHKVIHFSKQFYLRNIPRELEHIGKNKRRIVYSYDRNDYITSQANQPDYAIDITVGQT